MTKKILDKERLFKEVFERIHISENPPNLVLIAGPCRSGTTALSNVFAHAGYISYMQPIKSIRRAIEESVAAPEFNIKSGQKTIVSKETFGAKTASEYFDPVEILLKAGYPKEKIHLIAMMREPTSTLTSWTWMWEEVLMNGFIKAYRQTDSVLQNARSLGVATTSYVHEAIRDNNSELVIERLFNRIFGKVETVKSSVDWSREPNFENDKRVKFFDEPPERFVHAVKTWGGYEYRALKSELTPGQIVRLKNEGVFNIYNDFFQACKLDLGIDIQKNTNETDECFEFETKDTKI